VRRKLINKYSWFLILFTGIFQVLGFILDQYAIQTEDNIRETQYLYISDSEDRTSMLSINNRLVSFLVSHGQIDFLFNSSKLDKETIFQFKYYTLKDESLILINQLLSEEMIYNYIDKNLFSNLKKNYNQSKIIIAQTQSFILTNNFLIKLSDDKIDELNSLENLLDEINKDNGDLIREINRKIVESGNALEKPLQEITVKLSKLLLKKQRLLLFGIFFQLLSLFTLLLLFRTIIINNLNSKISFQNN